jgi:hypothetical protein
VGGVQAQRERDRSRGQRDAGAVGEGAAERREDHEARVAEDGQRHQEAHRPHGEGDPALAGHAQDRLRQLQGAAGLLEEGADHAAGQDHDADRAERPAEAGVHGAHHLREGHAGEDAVAEGRRQQREDRVESQPGGGQDDEGHREREQGQQSHGPGED